MLRRGADERCKEGPVFIEIAEKKSVLNSQGAVFCATALFPMVSAFFSRGAVYAQLK